MTLIYIVIPAWNESERTSRVLRCLQNTLTDTEKVKFKIVVVDDGSSDETYQDALSVNIAPVLRHVINRGQGAALMTGNEYALKHGADIIVHFDADDQHNPDDIQKLITPLIEESYDIVLGSRFMKDATIQPTLTSIIRDMITAKNIPFARRIFGLGSWVINTVMIGIVLTDIHNGLRAFTAETARKFDLRQDRMANATEYQNEIHRLHLKYKEVPMTVRYGNTDKERSQNFFDGIKVIKEMLVGKVLK